MRGFMSFSRFFRLQATLIAILIGGSFAAKTAKIHYAVGEVFLYRNSEKQVIKSSEPTPGLKKAKNVKEGDNIETLLESEAIIALPDGGSFSIQENTFVAITKLSFENGENNFETVVKKGSMKFDVQKQANNKSKIKFKTGNSTAAIRGTDGFVGVSNSCSIASLATGSLDFTPEENQNVTAITAGQTIVYCKKGLLVLDLATSGNSLLFNALDTLLSNTSLSLDALKKAILEKDKELSTRINDKKSKVKCSVVALPDTVYSPKQTVKATCTKGTFVRIFDQPIRSNGSEISFNVDWEPAEIGPKKFPLTCFIDGDNTTTFQCGLATTYYTQNSNGSTSKAPLTITSGTPLEVCDPAMATVEGTFDTTDQKASLTVSLGKYTSANLIPLSANGIFTHSIPVSDKNGNWEERNIYVNYTSYNGKHKETIPLKVTKSCKTVNLLPPKISLSTNKCKATLSLGQSKGDKSIYTFSVNNVIQKESYFEGDNKFTENLTQGVHLYTFQVEDLAGNKDKISKTLECFPPIKNAKIRFDNGDKEPSKIPPPPGNQTIPRTLSFSVTGLPQNDPIYIKQIVITQPGKQNILLRGTDLQSNHIDQQLDLPYGTTIIKITVTLKSGEILETSKPCKVP